MGSYLQNMPGKLGLVFSGEKDQFDDGVDRLLTEMWEVFRRVGYNPPMVAVPGNHDLRWPCSRSEQRIVSQIRKRINTDADFRQSVFAGKGSVEAELISRSFGQWSAWRERNHELQFGQGHAEHLDRTEFQEGGMPGDFSYRLRKHRCRLGVIGLNTALVQLDGSDYDGHLAVDSSQLSRCCPARTGRGWLSANDANVVLTHHPHTWLHPGSLEGFENDICVFPSVDLHLHGHLHAAAYLAEGKQPRRLLRHIQGMSLFGEPTYLDRRKGDTSLRLHGYVLVQVRVTAEANLIRFRPVKFTTDKRPVVPEEVHAPDRGWTEWETSHAKKRTAATAG
jgi:calcineurin-like phosphoesterase family protein